MEQDTEARGLYKESDRGGSKSSRQGIAWLSPVWRVHDNTRIGLFKISNLQQQADNKLVNKGEEEEGEDGGDSKITLREQEGQ